MRKLVSLVSLLGLAAAASTTLAAAPVSAAGTPDIGFKVPAHAHANKPTKVHWHASGVGHKTVVLQGYNGNTKIWGTFRHLHGSKGKTKIPAEPIGIYDFRIAVFDHAGKLITAKGHKLHVFGKVKWKTLFKSPLADGGNYDGRFPYVFRFFSNDVDYTALKVTDNPCTSVHIRYIPGADPESPNQSLSGIGTVKIGRHGRSSVQSQAAAQQEGKSHAALTLGKTWSINVSEDGAGSRIYNWYFNGTAVCDQTRITGFNTNQN
ncbi:MAG TPA: hypothetical protein VHE57_07900 [Mycobacteriales bacterium]|nr:hypothetical protein [Mycobacteriales bacterium]